MGASDHDLKLPAEVTQLRCFATNELRVMVAAGLGSIGEVHVLDSQDLTRQFTVRTSSVPSFRDFQIIEEQSTSSNSEE